MRLMELLRQTGRTQRMLAEAERCAEAGYRVIIVCETPSQAVAVKRDFRQYPNVLVFTINNADLCNHVNPTTLKAHDKNTNLFVDHGVIESRFAGFVQHLHKYDQTLIGKNLYLPSFIDSRLLTNIAHPTVSSQ